MNKKTITHLIIWSLTLTLFWLLLSGYFKPLLLAFGVFSVALVVYLLQRMDKADDQPQMPALGVPSLRYFMWLLGQVVLSSVEVTKLVWGGKKLSPTLAELPLDKVPEDNRVLYANSITLTPGTLSVDIDDDKVTVHALDEQSIKELEAGDMANKIADVMGKNS